MPKIQSVLALRSQKKFLKFYRKFFKRFNDSKRVERDTMSRKNGNQNFDFCITQARRISRNALDAGHLHISSMNFKGRKENLEKMN